MLDNKWWSVLHLWRNVDRILCRILRQQGIWDICVPESLARSWLVDIFSIRLKNSKIYLSGTELLVERPVTKSTTATLATSNQRSFFKPGVAWLDWLDFGDQQGSHEFSRRAIFCWFQCWHDIVGWLQCCHTVIPTIRISMAVRVMIRNSVGIDWIRIAH